MDRTILSLQNFNRTDPDLLGYIITDGKWYGYQATVDPSSI